MSDTPDLNPDIDAVAPSDPDLTPDDRRLLVTYLRLLDADAEGAPWQEVAQIVLGLDPESDAVVAQKTYESHLARARWMTEHGYMALLNKGSSD